MLAATYVVDGVHMFGYWEDMNGISGWCRKAAEGFGGWSRRVAQAFQEVSSSGSDLKSLKLAGSVGFNQFRQGIVKAKLEEEICGRVGR